MSRLLRTRTSLYVLAGAVVALLLRAPWSDAALGRDEGGVSVVARAWHGSGPFAYGSYFLDRPPLLPALYKLAGETQPGIRVLGAVAAVLLVLTTTLLAVRVAGRAAAPWAAGIAAVLASSYELRSVFTPAELLAAVPSSASVLVLLVALERERGRLRLFAASGALAAAALLVKQSFGDALVAGAVAIVAGKAFFGWAWRDAVRRAGAYAAGVVAVLLSLGVWVWISAATAHDVWYSMFGFRLDSASVLVKGGLESRLSSLGSPLLASGLALALVCAVAGLVWLRERPHVKVVFGAWMATAAAGILLGGSYWRHYLIALAAPAGAGAAALFQRYRIVGAVAGVAIAFVTVTHAVDVAIHDKADNYQRAGVTLGHYIRDRSEPGATLYVMYSKPNALYYSGLRVPYPYNWSLMIRAVPGARDMLRRVLASPERPTWILRTHGPDAFHLDANGETRRLLAQHYRRAATVCGVPLLLSRGAHVRPAPTGPFACAHAGSMD